MISVAEARSIVADCSRPLPPVVLPLAEAAGLVTAADLFSPIDSPPFRQAGMDGFAFRYADLKSGVPLRVVQKSAAGDALGHPLNSGEAARVFTGAPVPAGADTVVMQEKTKVEDGFLKISGDDLTAGTNVRVQGSDSKAGSLAFKRGTQLTPAAVGFAAGLGVDALSVYPNPRVCMFITGNELQQGGTPLRPGAVYESNSAALFAALHSLHIFSIEVRYAKDDLPDLTAQLQAAFAGSDVVLLTGGVSVGDYDFTVAAAQACGVVQRFHKVAQRPGKPLYFGTAGSKLVFGLPGNPSSVLSCFYNYVVPALQGLTQRAKLFQKAMLPLAAGYRKTKGLTHFLKGRVADGKAAVLGAQESYRLQSFAAADCLIECEGDEDLFEAGELVPVLLLQ